MTVNIVTDTAPARPAPTRLKGSAAGLLAAAAALGVAELVSGLFRGAISPVIAVGEWVIDHVPSWVKTFAVRRFGTNDKPALIAGTLVFVAVFAAVIGALAMRRKAIGVAGIAAFGLVGAAAAHARPNVTAIAMVPSLVGAAAGIATLLVLRSIVVDTPVPAVVLDDPSSAGTSALPAPSSLAEPVESPTDGLGRRRFLVAGAVTAVGAAATGGLGRTLRHRFSVASARNSVTLPAPASAAAARPAGVDLAVQGVESFMTPNSSFYRIDTALIAPQVDPGSWKLRIHGMVDHPMTLTYEQLLKRPMIERDLTLVCVSNEVGGHYTGTARWLGVPLKDLLAEVGVKAGADQLVSRSVDGWTAGSPTAALMDGRDAIVAVAMNGEPLPVAHGFPARLVVPGLYGYVSATKWVTDLELTTFSAFDAYWVRRDWAQQAPIKTMARIDTPRGLSSAAAGKVAVGGVAWAIHRGIDAVEVRIDDGPWQPARLGDVPNKDTWRQWVYEWDATPGRHSITARATDGTGVVQTDQRANPIPDGASGWHSVVVLVN